MTQFARPDADQAVGSWTPTPLWSAVDDDLSSTPSGDGTTIASNNNINGDTADLRLSDISTPQAGTQTGRVRWNKSASGGHTINAVCELWEGVPGTGTLRGTVTVNDISEVEQESTFTASGITDYTNLYVRLIRNGSTGGAGGTRRSLVVDAFQFETPDAGAVTKNDSDSGSGSDAVSNVRYDNGDSGTGTDTAVVTVPKPDTDTGAGSDTQILVVVASATESGAGADNESLSAVVSLTDAGEGTDDAVFSVSIVDSDSGAGADNASMQVAGEQKADSDTGAGTDDALPGVVLSDVESGTSADNHTLVATAQVTDASAGSDDATITNLVSLVDSGALSQEDATQVSTYLEVDSSQSVQETEALVAVVGVTDAGSGSDSATLITPGAASGFDTGTGDDDALVVVSVANTDVGVGTEAVTAVAILSDTDFGEGSDIGSTETIVSVTASDQGSGADEGVATTSVFGDDLGTGDDDTASTLVSVFVVDPAVGSDATTILAVFATEDSGLAVEVVSVSLGTPWGGASATIRKNVDQVSPTVLAGTRITSTIKKSS